MAAGDRLNDPSSFIGDETVEVDDSREGWVETWTRVIDLATDTAGVTNVIIDINAVRPYGALLKTFGGTASGPDALVRSLIGITDITNAVAVSTMLGRHLRGLEAMEIDHALAAAIVAGGARRSARMAIMSWKDRDIFEFIHLKEDHQSHWTTNISVEIDDDFHVALMTTDHPMHEHAESVLREVVAGMVRDGEPGMIDTDAMSRDEPTPIRITNPCAEASLVSYDIDGRIAGESCNLGSVDLDAFGTDIDGAAEASPRPEPLPSCGAPSRASTPCSPVTSSAGCATPTSTWASRHSSPPATRSPTTSTRPTRPSLSSWCAIRSSTVTMSR